MLENTISERELIGALARRIASTITRPLQVMEVCGTHTHSIFRYGLRSLLPPDLKLISGPGCPVCVTSQEEIDKFIALARHPGVVVATFGDMIRVPGSGGSLQDVRAQGAAVEMVYSPAEALALAEVRPEDKVVFLAVGFETTAPVVAAVLQQAKAKGVGNFFVAVAHKTMVPAIEAILSSEGMKIDALLCPGHVSTIIGAGAYRDLAERFRIPFVIAGFGPADILYGLCRIVEMCESGDWGVDNAYPWAVTEEGNLAAQALLSQVFESCDAEWRGLGRIEGSGLRLAPGYERFDVFNHFDIEVEAQGATFGCRCGEVLIGRISPVECPLFMVRCLPEKPVGPCMVSSEGTCSAYAEWGDLRRE